MDINLENILSRFGINKPPDISQIHERAWSIGGGYVLKSNENKAEFDKSINLTRLLLSEGIPVAEYLAAKDGGLYVFDGDKYWCLMKQIKGTVFNPFVGEPEYNGAILGKAVAKLHMALKNIEDKLGVYEADFHKDLLSWIIPEIEKGKITFGDGVMGSLRDFFERDYKLLPRRLIHRDIHTSNMLFENGVLSGYLDFDMSQRNARVFDIVYLGCSQLAENYKDKMRLKIWSDIFKGILQGYDKLLPLGENEIKALPVLFVFDEVLFTAFYLKIGRPEIAKNCAEMADWLHKNIAACIPHLIGSCAWSCSDLQLSLNQTL